MRIIDTPGFFDTKIPKKDNYEKMSYIIDLFKDDADIDGIIFVFNFKDVRKDQRYKELIKNLRDIFGMDVLKKRLKIIFTNAAHGVEYNKDKEEKQREQMVEFIGKEIILKDDMIFINTHENLINNYKEDIIGLFLFGKFNEIKKMYGSMNNQKMEKIKKELEEKKKKELEEKKREEEKMTLEKENKEKEKEKEKEIDKKQKN